MAQPSLVTLPARQPVSQANQTHRMRLALRHHLIKARIKHPQHQRIQVLALQSQGVFSADAPGIVLQQGLKTFLLRYQIQRLGQDGSKQFYSGCYIGQGGHLVVFPE